MLHWLRPVLVRPGRAGRRHREGQGVHRRRGAGARGPQAPGRKSSGLPRPAGPVRRGPRWRPAPTRTPGPRDSASSSPEKVSTVSPAWPMLQLRASSPPAGRCQDDAACPAWSQRLCQERSGSSVPSASLRARPAVAPGDRQVPAARCRTGREPGWGPAPGAEQDPQAETRKMRTRPTSARQQPGKYCQAAQPQRRTKIRSSRRRDTADHPGLPPAPCIAAAHRRNKLLTPTGPCMTSSPGRRSSTPGTRGRRGCGSCPAADHAAACGPGRFFIRPGQAAARAPHRRPRR